VGSILIIDDEFGLAEALEALLSDRGHVVRTAANGALGLAQLRTPGQTVDLILLDVMMPVLDGPSTLRALQEDAALRHIPVILMSAVPEATVRAECAGFRTFLRKPFKVEALFAAVDALAP
jgi:CheY-like chemotaxis protein